MVAKNYSEAHWLGLAGRVCVVTGGGSGMGVETARQRAKMVPARRNGACADLAGQ